MSKESQGTNGTEALCPKKKKHTHSPGVSVANTGFYQEAKGDLFGVVLWYINSAVSFVAKEGVSF